MIEALARIDVVSIEATDVFDPNNWSIHPVIFMNIRRFHCNVIPSMRAKNLG